MRLERLFLVVAALLGLAGLAYLYLTSPTRLAVAVGPAGGPDHKLMEAFSTLLAEQRTGLRLSVAAVADVREAAAVLERRGAALAVARPDVANPANGLTVAILRDDVALVLAPAAAKIADAAGLAGKRLGVVTELAGDPGLVAQLLRSAEGEAGEPRIAPVTREGALAGLRGRTLDAVAIVASPAAPGTAEFVREVAKAAGGKLAFVPVEGADALYQSSLVISAATVPEGAFGVRPKLPDREIKTAGVSHRLMARADADRGDVALVAEQLFQMRSRLALATRSANLMRPPDTDPSSTATLPNHPGAVDYFQREQQTFMDRYGDYVYLGAFFGSGLISVGAWLWQRLVRRRRERIDDVLDRLLGILADARAARNPDRLDAITAEIDGMLAAAVGLARKGSLGSQATSALMIALEGARSAVEDRRRQIAADGGGRAAPEPSARLVGVG